MYKTKYARINETSLNNKKLKIIRIPQLTPSGDLKNSAN